MVRSFVRAELEKQDPQVRDQQKMRTLADKSFYYLTEDEIRKMKEAVRKARAASQACDCHSPQARQAWTL